MDAPDYNLHIYPIWECSIRCNNRGPSVPIIVRCDNQAKNRTSEQQSASEEIEDSYKELSAGAGRFCITVIVIRLKNELVFMPPDEFHVVESNKDGASGWKKTERRQNFVECNSMAEIETKSGDECEDGNVPEPASQNGGAVVIVRHLSEDRFQLR